MSDLDECMLSKCHGGFRVYNNNSSSSSNRNILKTTSTVNAVVAEQFDADPHAKSNVPQGSSTMTGNEPTTTTTTTTLLAPALTMPKTTADSVRGGGSGSSTLTERTPPSVVATDLAHRPPRPVAVSTTSAPESSSSAAATTMAVATTSHPAGHNRSRHRPWRRWSKAEKEAFEEMLPICLTSDKCMKEMAARLNSRFPNNAPFTIAQCKTQRQLLKRTRNKLEQKQREMQQVMDRINQQRQDRQQQALGQNNRTEGNNTISTARTVEEIPLPSSNEWVDGLPSQQQKIYDSTSIRGLQKGFLEHIAICQLRMDQDFFKDVRNAKPSRNVRERGPAWRPSGGDFSSVIEMKGPNGKKRVAEKSQELVKLAVESIKESGKWDSADRVFLEASSMISTGEDPQSAHYDWVYKWVDSDEATTKGRGVGDKIHKSEYPLSILIPTTQAGMYIQVWDPEVGGHGYILYVKFGEMLMFDPECLHGGNIGGAGDYPRLHCFCAKSPSHIPSNRAMGPHCHHKGHNKHGTWYATDEICQSSLRQKQKRT